MAQKGGKRSFRTYRTNTPMLQVGGSPLNIVERACGVTLRLDSTANVDIAPL